jgi:CHAT domain-containing protein
VNPQSSHLTDPEIKEYVRGSELDENQQSHIAVCDRCRKRVLEEERSQLGVLQRTPARRRPDCPGEAALQEYAAGLCTSEIASDVIRHAAHCDFCAPLLRTYLADFSGDFSAEEQEFLSRIPAPTNWRKPAGKRGAEGVFAKIKRFFLRFQSQRLTWGIAAAGAGLASIAIAVSVLPGWIAGRRLNEAEQLMKAEQFTATAFAGNPKTELKYALSPLTFDMKLGGESPQISPSGLHALHEAQPLADDHENSRDPKWLRINGRLALLNEDGKKAIGFLQSAYDQDLRDADTEIDLAAAYFLRDTAKSAKDGQAPTPNVAETVDLLLKVLKEPNLTASEREAALYDLARAYEAMLQWPQAVEKWEQYLALDAAGPWREEAERRLVEDRQKIPPRLPEGYTSPVFFEQHSSDAVVRENIEEYQDAALRTWLLDAIAGHAEAKQAIRRLGDMLERQYDDPWMNDFLRSSLSGDWRAEQALSAAITSNKRGLPTPAQDYANKAEVLFEQTRNMPGVLRSRFEAVYAKQRRLKDNPCVEEAQSLDAALRGTAYRWLQIQTALTDAVCLNRDTQFKAADEKLEAGRQDAVRFRFQILELRAMALNAALNVERDCDKTWRTATSGLDRYWQGRHPPMRLYEFYSPIKQCLEKRNLWHAGEALERRLSAILEEEVSPDDKNATLEQTAHDSLQEFLIALGEQEEYEAPRNASHSDPVSATYELPIKIRIAELQLSRLPQTALATLEKTESLVETTQDGLIRLEFYRVHGDVLLKLQHPNEAEAAYAAGLEIAERALDKLKNGSKRRQWAKETGEIYRGLVGALLGQGYKVEALQLWEWYKSRLWGSDFGTTSSGGASWSEIESEVRRVPLLSKGPDTRLIYAYVKDRLYIWTIGAAGLNMPPPIEMSRNQLQNDIDEYVQEIRTEDSDMTVIEEDSRKLFSALLTPAIPDLRHDGTVEAELDPLMERLPIEALKSPEGWYFGQRYPVIYSPGLIEESGLRSFSLHPPASGWLLNALTVSNREITGRLPGIEVFNAADTTAESFADHLARSEMFIFWGHGEAGGLQMPGRPPLQAKDFPPESLQRLQLAAFIACSSGAGGDGVPDTINLIHALLSGGVPEVIASKWDVSRESTERMLGRFYQHLLKGETPAHAMLEARQYVFQTGQVNPYYWAAFTLNGKDR